jgi:hypothetical protein
MIDMAKKRASLEAWRARNAEHVKEYKRQYNATHKVENAAAKKRRRLERIQENAEYRKANNLRSNYGMTVEQYNELFESQNGCCAICGRHQSIQKKALAVDHDHQTGKIRGLLCSACNTGIGNMHDDEQTLLNAIKYLAGHR